MAFLSRLFRRDDPLTEREQARRQGMRDARRHPLGEFTDPDFQPAFVAEIRARARERITEVDRRLAATRTVLLERALGEREVILRELGRSGTRPEPPVNGHAPAEDETDEQDPFISIAEARVRRAEARRRALVEEANAGVQRARARIEHLTQEWESALLERDHEVEAVHARAEQHIAAYKGGVLEVHPRKEEVPPLWKGEVVAMEATEETATAISGREEIARILREVEDRIEVWHAEVMPQEVPTGPRQLPSPPPSTAEPAAQETSETAEATCDRGGEPPSIVADAPEAGRHARHVPGRRASMDPGREDG
ncbi:hypothetical protein ABZ897_13155 [Nonomuraea sp. NPDC046802]|uniref:hypothetical protein n=1 Tax=Nonomuraea sp. NPDC046802 TaxID=3154919 RepID=UPI00340D7EB3